MTALTAPYALAQGTAPPAAAAPASPPASPAAKAPTPASPAAKAPAPAPPFKKSLSDTLTGIAKAEYESGKILYADGDYAGASLKFQLAYEASKDPRLLWNMAAAEKNLRRYGRVVELIERYMSEAGTRITAGERAEAEALLSTVKAFISDVTFEVTPEGATVFVDDTQVGVSPIPAPVRVEMGEHRIRVSKPGYRDFAATQSFQGGAPVALAVALQEALHQGRLRVVAGQGDTIAVDGKVVGTSEWEGVLPSGIHGITVTGQGKRPFQSDVAVQDDQSQSMRVALDPVSAPSKGGAGMAWLWIAGGAVLAAGLGVGAYLAFKPEDEPPVEGTLGTVELPMRWGF